LTAEFVFDFKLSRNEDEAALISLLLDARGGNAVAFPDKPTIPHLAPANGKPKFSRQNAKLKMQK
jgi:hypothetical protein